MKSDLTHNTHHVWKKILPPPLEVNDTYGYSKSPIEDDVYQFWNKSQIFPLPTLPMSQFNNHDSLYPFWEQREIIENQVWCLFHCHSKHGALWVNMWHDFVRSIDLITDLHCYQLKKKYYFTFSNKEKTQLDTLFQKGKNIVSAVKNYLNISHDKSYRHTILYEIDTHIAGSTQLFWNGSGALISSVNNHDIIESCRTLDGPDAWQFIQENKSKILKKR